MKEQLIGALLISLLHGFIPGHWMPFLALSKKLGLSRAETMRKTSMAATAHTLGTVLLGLVIYFITSFGLQLDAKKHGINEKITATHHTAIHIMNSDFQFEFIGGFIMILLGIYFLYRHHTHKHFHFPEQGSQKSQRFIFGTVLLALFLSPCMEIEVYFATLAPFGFPVILALILVYSVSTWLSMMGGVWIGYKGLERWNSHRLEHNVGIFSGVIMILSGLLLMFA